MFTAILLTALIQPPAVQPAPKPPETHKLNGLRLEEARRLHPGIVVVESPNTFYATVQGGVIVQTYQLVPVPTVPVVVAPAAVVVEPAHSRRFGWFGWFRR